MTAVNKPGLPKLNMPKGPSAKPVDFKHNTASKLSTATRTSFGIKAQRSDTRSIFNAKAYYGSSLDNTTKSLNASRTPLFINNFGKGGHVCNHNNNGTNTLAGIMSAMGVLNSLALQTASVIKSGKSDSSSTSSNNTTTLTESDKIINSLSSAKTSKDIQSGLDGIDDRLDTVEKSINDIDTNIDKAIENRDLANDGYNNAKENKQKTRTSIESITKGLEKIDSQLIYSSLTEEDQTNLNKQKNELESYLELEQKNLTKYEEDEERYKKEVDNCTKDINEYGDKKSNLKSEQTKLEQAKEQYNKKLTSTLNSEESKLGTLSKDISKLKEQFGNETDQGKKQNISENYTKKVNEFNKLIETTSSTKYTALINDINLS